MTQSDERLPLVEHGVNENIIFKATLAREQLENTVRCTFSVVSCYLSLCLGFFLCYPVVTYRQKQIVDSWHAYVTNKTLYLGYTDRSLIGIPYPKVHRIPLTDIVYIGITEIGVCDRCLSTPACPGDTCVTVISKQEQSILCPCCDQNRKIDFYWIQNPDEFVQAVQRQMAAVGNFT